MSFGELGISNVGFVLLLINLQKQIVIFRHSKYWQSYFSIRFSIRYSHDSSRNRSFFSLKKENIFLISKTPLTQQSKQQITNSLKGEYLKWRQSSKIALRKFENDISVSEAKRAFVLVE